MSKQESSLFHESAAVIDLPMRLVVTLIIGTVALSSIIAFIAQPCLIPQNLSVSLDPLVTSVNTSERNVSIRCVVTDEMHMPVKDAVVLIRGNHVIKANRTDDKGLAILVFEVSFPEGISEMFFDVVVKSSCATTQTLSNAVKIIQRQ